MLETFGNGKLELAKFLCNLSKFEKDNSLRLQLQDKALSGLYIAIASASIRTLFDSKKVEIVQKTTHSQQQTVETIG